MKKRIPGLDRWGRCLRISLILGNCCLAIIGCIVIGVGIYLAVDKLQFVSPVFGIPIIVASSHIIIAAGCLVLLVSVIGCSGAMFYNNVLLIAYGFALSLVFLLAMIGAVLAIVFRSWMSEQVRTYMTATIKDMYGVNLNSSLYNQFVTTSWDTAQQKWYCCGVDDSSWGVYRASFWYQNQPGIIDFDRPYVPASCCRKDQYGNFYNLQKCQNWIQGPPGKQSGQKNEYLFYTGCYTAGKDLLYQIAGYLIGIGLGLALAALGGIILSLCLLRRL